MTDTDYCLKFDLNVCRNDTFVVIFALALGD